MTWTSAPRASPSEKVAAATPPPIPTTRRRSPCESRVRPSMRCAVPVTRPYEPASSQVSCAGLGSALAAGTTTNSARVPQACSPNMPKRRHAVEFPERHDGHSPQESEGSITTSSPTATDSTPGPTASMMPAPSPPATCGKLCGAGRPRDTHMSRWLRAAVRSRIMYLAGSRFGVGNLFQPVALRSGRLVELPGEHRPDVRPGRRAGR